MDSNLERREERPTAGMVMREGDNEVYMLRWGDYQKMTPDGIVNIFSRQRKEYLAVAYSEIFGVRAKELDLSKFPHPSA